MGARSDRAQQPARRTSTDAVLEQLVHCVHFDLMKELLISYSRVSTNEQDLTAQQNALERLGVRPALISTNHGLTGNNRSRPGLHEALAASRGGDTLVVAKLDRLARSLRGSKYIIDELTLKDVKLASADPSTTRTTPSDDCSSTSSPWSPNSSQTLSEREPVKVWRSRKPDGSCAENHPSSSTHSSVT